MGDKPPSEKSEKDENLKKRGYVIKELISTEKTYLNQLDIVIQVFIDPIRKEEILNESDIHSQFLNWETIYGLHKHLLEQLTEPLKTNPDDPNAIKVGAIFKTYSYFLKMYMQYLSNFELAMTRRAEIMCQNRKFAQLLETALTDPRCNGSGIESFLVTPVQRIPRYRMLLQEILKYTPKDHEDFEDLNNSLLKVSEVANANNEAIRQREFKDQIMRVMMTIESKSRINLLDEPTRVFKREADMFRQCSDKLLYGELTSSVVQSKSYCLNRDISLLKCRVSDVTTGEKSNITPEEKAIWLKDIENCMEELRQKYMIETGKIAPVWIPDSHSNNCSVCKDQFSMFFRKHHCRNCGSLVCNSCSPNQIIITFLSAYPVRVCSPCYDKLSAENIQSNDGKDDFVFVSNRMSTGRMLRRGTVFMGLAKKEVQMPIQDDKPRLRFSTHISKEFLESLGSNSENMEDLMTSHLNDMSLSEQQTNAPSSSLSSLEEPPKECNILSPSPIDIAGNNSKVITPTIKKRPPPPPKPQRFSDNSIINIINNNNNNNNNNKSTDVSNNDHTPSEEASKDQMRTMITEDVDSDSNSDDSEEESKAVKQIMSKYQARRQSIKIQNNPLMNLK